MEPSNFPAYVLLFIIPLLILTAAIVAYLAGKEVGEDG